MSMAKEKYIGIMSGTFLEKVGQRETPHTIKNLLK